ncbi:twin-arginine translocation signal domain-containing protein [Rhodococcus qingshengii]|nr:twin-arginine translocation signal domain-containing protein [Rhodococcus qingshengii]
MKRQRTVYEVAMDHGFSRRDFLKMCTALAATLGLDYTQSHQVVKAMEIKNRVPVVWLQFQDCTGCSETFIRSSQPKTESVLLEIISLEYSDVISAPSGHQAEASMKQVLKDYKGEYILAVEGSIPDDDAFLTVGGVSAKETFLEMASGAQAIIAYGSCSSWGGIAVAHPNPTGAKPVTRFIKDTPTILVPGCPPIAEDFHLIMKINEVDLPVREEVHGVCDLLGFDPLYLANEGKSIIIVAANEADKVIDILSEFPEGRDAVVIGSITGKQKGQLLLETPLGSKRLLNRLSGTMFPRIC